MQNSRRDWLKQTACLLAAATAGTDLLANRVNTIFSDDTPVFLNSNENPYGPSPMARQAILDHYLGSNRYPDQRIEDLRSQIADHWNVSAENILLGAGSSEIIGLALSSIVQDRKKMIVSDPAYSVWQGQAKALNFEAIKLPLNSKREYDLPAMSKAAKETPHSFVYICNPNNPTGVHIDPLGIRKTVEDIGPEHLCFIDEAYTEYAGIPTLAAFAISRPNIIVAKTFSKIYGLAGARVGYAIAHPQTITRLASLQPWPNANISAVSAAAAIASLNDQTFTRDCLEKTEAAKAMCYKSFQELHLEYIPSSANFILFNISNLQKDISARMKERNIFIQHREHFGGRWCRVTMGTIPEMERFLKVLREILA